MLSGRGESWGAVWAEGREGGCAQRLESAGPLRADGPRLGWEAGRAAMGLLSDRRRDQTRGASRLLWPQLDHLDHEKNRTDTQEERLQAWGPGVEMGTTVGALT